MTREQILAVIAKHLANAVDDIDPATIDPSKSMKDFGANSLDVVEVVSASMRELKVKIPRSELNKLTDVNGLVDLLHSTMQKNQAAHG